MNNTGSKVIVITGASSGIGDETAKLLAKNRFGRVDVLFANAVLYAVSQPDNVDVSNLVVQPTAEN